MTVLIATLAIALALRVFVVMPRTIPSESMLPSLYPGDVALVLEWPYALSRLHLPRLRGSVPGRGDVVVFRAPGAAREDYVKRVIGLPGDTVAMAGGRLLLNGRAVPTYRVADFAAPRDAGLRCVAYARSGADGALCRWPRWRETLPGGRAYETIDQGATAADDRAAVRVPAGHYFVLGDNRDISADSRFPVGPEKGVGLVPADAVEGRAVLVLLSTGGASFRHPIAWLRGLRLTRTGARP